MTQLEKLYAERDASELDEAGNYYIKHVIAMTAEQLHSKSAIAAELAHRDMLIDKLTDELQAAKTLAVPDGYRLMPPEPTPEMIEAWFESRYDQDPSENFAIGYDAMFLAATEQPK